MESGPYFWQTNGTNNGTGNIQGGDFIQQPGTSQQQQMTQDASMTSTETLPTAQASNTSGFSQQNETKNIQSHADGNVTVKPQMPIEISNPDAIEPKPRTYTCRICQMMFPNKSAVTVHSRLHTDHQGKPYRCSFCDKGFSTNFYLKQHERIHSGQKPYKCPMCEQSFKQLSHVQQHVRTHTGVRPYKCHWPGCEKAFLQQSHLKSHEARHTPKTGASGEKPYKCHWPDCGKSFAQLTNLKSHVARHTPGKSRSKKGGSSQKKTEEKSEASTSTLSLQDVINQAAAAADIVPGASTSTSGESEIRPFLCPGCSKVYVREATFKKHLEECKTKLQLSISATATALGIAPPTADTVLDYNSATIQLSTSSAQEKAPEIKNATNSITFTTQTVSHNTAAPPSDSSNVSKAEVRRKIQVKEEHPTTNPLPQVTNINTEQIFTTSSYKLEQVSSPIAATAASTTQNSVLHYDTRGGQMMPVSEVAITSGGPLQPPDNNYILSSAPTVEVSGGSIPPTTSEHLIEGSNPTASEHSTINQAAIRWQWDQSIPRLNFP